MTHKLKTETFSQKIEGSGDVIVLPLIPLFSFVTSKAKNVAGEMTPWRTYKRVAPWI